MYRILMINDFMQGGFIIAGGYCADYMQIITAK